MYIHTHTFTYTMDHSPRKIWKIWNVHVNGGNYHSEGGNPEPERQTLHAVHSHLGYNWWHCLPPNIAHKLKKPATGKGYLFWVVQSVESTRSIPLLPLQTSLLRLPIADTRVTGHGKTKSGPTWNLHIYWLAHCMLKREIFNEHGPCTIMTNWAYWYAHWCNIRPIMERTNYFLND